MKQEPQQQQPAQQPPPAGAGVPAFLSKLWALVGEAPSNQLITWSQVRRCEPRPLVAPPRPRAPRLREAGPLWLRRCGHEGSGGRDDSRGLGGAAWGGKSGHGRAGPRWGERPRRGYPGTACGWK